MYSIGVRDKQGGYGEPRKEDTQTDTGLCVRINNGPKGRLTRPKPNTSSRILKSPTCSAIILDKYKLQRKSQYLQTARVVLRPKNKLVWLPNAIFYPSAAGKRGHPERTSTDASRDFLCSELSENTNIRHQQAQLPHVLTLNNCSLNLVSDFRLCNLCLHHIQRHASNVSRPFTVHCVSVLFTGRSSPDLNYLMGMQICAKIRNQLTKKSCD